MQASGSGHHAAHARSSCAFLSLCVDQTAGQGQQFLPTFFEARIPPLSFRDVFQHENEVFLFGVLVTHQ